MAGCCPEKSITSGLKLQSQQLEDAGSPHSLQLSRLNFSVRESGADVLPRMARGTCKRLGGCICIWRWNLIRLAGSVSQLQQNPTALLDVVESSELPSIVFR